VLGLARGGLNVAFLSRPYRSHCGPHVEFWDLVTGGVHKLGRHTDAFCSESPSTGSGVTDLAVANDRVAWLAYTGGHLRDWILYTATPTLPTGRQLELREVDVDAPPPIVLGTGSEWVIRLVVQLPGGRIEVHNGRHVHVFSIPPQAKMLDYGENTLLYRIGNTLHGR
jgi:hypothetical protein